MAAREQKRVPPEPSSAMALLAILSFAILAPMGCSISGSQAATSSASLQHTVTLSWTASSSSASGYNIYRSTVSGGAYTKINSVLQAATSYVDNTVQSGTTYFYVATAVDSNGIESAFSNEAKAIIPSP